MAYNRRYGRSRRSGGYSRPKPKPLTEAQLEANRKKFDAASHTVTGRNLKGQVVQDYKGNFFRVVTIGFGYHEDVSSRIYGCNPARPSKAVKTTMFLVETIDDILRHGTQEPGSRAEAYEDGKGLGQPLPEEAKAIGAGISWTAQKPGSLASFPSIGVYEGGYLRAVRPIYDDSPVMAWVHDPKLAAKVQKAIEECPTPHFVTQMEVLPRKVKEGLEP